MPCFSIRSKLLSEEIDRSMEGAICQGWLTKSPPEKKMPGPRRIFPSKWRKRYFVLRMPPASISLPGSCGLLEYYDSAHCTKRRGNIDLDQCEQVTVSLDTYDYRNLFALYSKHKGRSRTYYLAAENETAMNHWVECLCKVCGFKPEEDRPEDEWPSRPAPVPVQTDRYLPEPERVPFQERQSDMPDIVPRPVAPSEGHNYKPRRTTLDTSSSPARAGNEVALDSIPPPPNSHHRGRTASVDSTDSIPDEPAPAPPIKGGQLRLDSQDGLHDPMTYDHPTRSYTNLPPHQNQEGTYQVPPPPKHVNGTGRKPSVENMLVNVPPAAPTMYSVSPSKRDSNSSSGSRGSNRQGGSASSSDDTYDPVPLPRPYGGDRAKDLRLGGSLDHRTPGRRGGGGSQQKSDNNSTLQKTVPAPSQDSHNKAEYINVPPNSVAFRKNYENLDERPKHHRQQSPSVATSTVSGVMDPTYDVPPTRKDDASGLVSKPPPPPHQVSMQHYVNAPNHKPTGDMFVPPPSQPPLDDNVYLPMKPGHEKGVYLPMSPVSGGMQDINVPPGGGSGRDGANLDYLNMGQYGGGGGGNVPVSPAVYRNKGATTNDSVYLPMQRPESDTYMPMVPGSYDENYMPMANNMDRCSVNSVYTDMNSAGPPPSQQAPTQPPSTHSIYEVPPSNKPVPMVPPRTIAITEPPRLQPQTSHPPTNVTDGVLVYTSQRTKSFKREVPRSHKPPKPLPRSQPPPPDPPLPRKKTTASTGESSSDEDDDESISSLDRSSDTISVHKPSKVDMLSKKSLNSTPPPPKRPGEVQYLDLALEKGADTERSPVFPRSPPPPVSHSHRAPSPTEYKEIDFVKTKALTEMKKDVESKRKSSEKSVDE